VPGLHSQTTYNGKTKRRKAQIKKKLNCTWSSVILRKGEPPPIEAYASLDLGARSVDISFANGCWRNRNSLGSRMISYINTRNILAYKHFVFAKTRQNNINAPKRR